MNGPQKLIQYAGKGGRHQVAGHATHVSYGYRTRGDTFLVYEDDIRARPDLFRVIEQPQPTPQPVPTGLKSAVPRVQELPPEPIVLGTTEIYQEPISVSLADLGNLKINSRAMASLSNAGVTTVAHVMNMTDDDLLFIKGVGVATVEALREAVGNLK